MGIEPGHRYEVGRWKYGQKDEVLGVEGRSVTIELVEVTHPHTASSIDA